MQVIAKTKEHNIATVYIAESKGDLIEFVESVQPPLPLTSKWVLIISSMIGCPVQCLMCDAGGSYKRKLSKDEMLFQIDYMVKKRFASGLIPTAKFKIQFARVGEPTFNSAVLDVLAELPTLYNVSGLTPAISTIAPYGCEAFFEQLLLLKNKLYANGKFQLQFSIHATDLEVRDRMIPIKKWSFAQIADYGENFYSNNDRKITLNFALAETSFLQVAVLKKYFDPQKFLIKITPINPTITANKNKLVGCLNNCSDTEIEKLVVAIKQAGYDVIISIGESVENIIGSNCGQYIKRFLHSNISLTNSYKTELEYF